ncbi:arf-GAP with Rho-GAP domain, ANK repeat and PH domain-containing protein 1 isoform X2 [Lepisosteus oculatus]|uniref:arf-GAP with Rho-GAP domain, ANK repeat and PH domain-containing protein 1 isoform X2 n=1 Tax=Lepisosteus oculatus TaxID=7918 RepID=UPI0037119280
MSAPVDSEVTPPVPKPRARYTWSVESTPAPPPVPRRMSSNNILDSETANSQAEPESERQPPRTGNLRKWNSLGQEENNDSKLFLNVSHKPELKTSHVFTEAPDESNNGFPMKSQRQHSAQGVFVWPALPALCPVSSKESQFKHRTYSDAHSPESPRSGSTSDKGSPPMPDSPCAQDSQTLEAPARQGIEELEGLELNANWNFLSSPSDEGSAQTRDRGASVAQMRQEKDENIQYPSLQSSDAAVQSDQGLVSWVEGSPACSDPPSAVQNRQQKCKAPRVATIRVSRRKQTGVEWQASAQAEEAPVRDSVVSRSSWLEVWQGRRHRVLWVTLDGKLLSLWKKRTDKFTEVVLHVSCITNVQSLEKGRFSISTPKKHFEFMANNEAVRDGWVRSLHASRGQKPQEAPQQCSTLVMKDPRAKVYGAVFGHELWIYHSKEDFANGVGMFYISMDVAQVKQTGRRNFSLITPYKTFSFQADSSREQAVWLASLTQVIRNALSCSEVAQHIWASPWNKVCADCGSANPEWASINLLTVICDACAGQHRSMGTSVSKVRSLKMDRKVWTEPLIQLFVLYGNKAANEVWGYNVPGAEQILADATPNERRAFVLAKYSKGLYRRAHPLACSQELLNKRLCEVVTGPDVSETLSLLCSGARVMCQTGDPQCPSPISLAERAGQALQTELLRHNEYTEAPACNQQPAKQDHRSSAVADPPQAPSDEELHGKLEDDQFLFSEENDSAACDVLDLKEVISIFDCSSGPTHEFEMLTLRDRMQCVAPTQEVLSSHMQHIMKVLLPWPVPSSELDGVRAFTRVSLREGGRLEHREVWAALRNNELLLYSTRGRQREKVFLTSSFRCNVDAAENTIELVTVDRCLSLQFELQRPCQCWNMLLKILALTAAGAGRGAPLYPAASSLWSEVPAAIEKCIYHITQHGLTVEGIYRRCGTALKISKLVELLNSAPNKVQFDSGESGVLDAAGALKLCLRQQVELIPQSHMSFWVQAAAHPVEAERLTAYRRGLDSLSAGQRAILKVLFEHLYQVQLYSHVNRMTPQNLALVFVPTVFRDYGMSTDMGGALVETGNFVVTAL